MNWWSIIWRLRSLRRLRNKTVAQGALVLFALLAVAATHYEFWVVLGLLVAAVLFWRYAKTSPHPGTNVHRSIEWLHALTWQGFEEEVADLYRTQGYRATITGGGGADGGVDVIAKRETEKIVIQCKHWPHGRVPVQTVREIIGVMAVQRATKAVVATSGSFTEDALKLGLEARDKIELYDGSALIRKLNSLAS